MVFEKRDVNSCFILKKELHEDHFFSFFEAKGTYSANIVHLAFLKGKSDLISEEAAMEYREFNGKILRRNSLYLKIPFDIDRHEGRFFLAYSNMKHLPLSFWLESKTSLPKEIVLHILRDSLLALKDLEGLGSSHHFLSPEEILLPTSWKKGDHVLLSHSGLFRLIKDIMGKQDLEHYRQRYWKGNDQGNFFNIEKNIGNDLYSLGVIIQELLTLLDISDKSWKSNMKTKLNFLTEDLDSFNSIADVISYFQSEFEEIERSGVAQDYFDMVKYPTKEGHVSPLTENRSDESMSEGEFLPFLKSAESKGEEEVLPLLELEERVGEEEVFPFFEQEKRKSENKVLPISKLDESKRVEKVFPILKKEEGDKQSRKVKREKKIIPLLKNLSSFFKRFFSFRARRKGERRGLWGKKITSSRLFTSSEPTSVGKERERLSVKEILRLLQAHYSRSSESKHVSIHPGTQSEMGKLAQKKTKDKVTRQNVNFFNLKRTRKPTKKSEIPIDNGRNPPSFSADISSNKGTKKETEQIQESLSVEPLDGQESRVGGSASTNSINHVQEERKKKINKTENSAIPPIQVEPLKEDIAGGGISEHPTENSEQVTKKKNYWERFLQFIIDSLRKIRK